MACGSGKPTNDLTGIAAEVVIISDDEIDQHPGRAAIYGDGTEPMPEADPSPNDGPLWRMCDVEPCYWQWLDASVQPNYTKLGWQAERVWTKVKDCDKQYHFRAALGILSWEPMEMPVYAVIMKVALPDSDRKTKVLMLLVEPGGNPRGWDTFNINRLQRCVYKECYRSRMVDTQFPLFTDEEKLRRAVRAIVAWVLSKPTRLSDIFKGTWSDLPLI